MKITEKKEVVRTNIEEVIVGRKCDICGNEIKPLPNGHGYNYFVIHTFHNDWGNDSVDSNEYFDACCPMCVILFVSEYVNKAYKSPFNTREIEVGHTRSL